MRPSVADIRLGAIYRLAVRCGLPRVDVERLLTERAAMRSDAARQLSAHWFTTEKLRGVPATKE